MADDSSVLDTTEKQRQQPLNPGGPSLNDKLNAFHIDVADDDRSIPAAITRWRARVAAFLFTPRQMIAILRVLKAVTFCFLLLTVLSDIMYMIFLEITASNQVREMAGGTRDTIIRVYGMLLALVSLGVEMNHSGVLKKFSGLKGFIPRSLLLFFIAVITGSHPIYNENNSQNYQYNDAADDQVVNDDAVSQEELSSEIPSSAVGFQMVTSFIL